MPNPIARLERSIRRFALAVAVLVALAVPAVYGLQLHRDLAASLLFKAQVKAAALTESIAANPTTWMYAENRLNGLVARERIPLLDELIEVHGRDGARITATGSMPSSPVMSRSYPLHDAGEPVGYIRVTGILRPLLAELAAAAVLGLILAGLVHLVLKHLPLRALTRATAALAASERRFRSIFENVPNIAVQGYDTHGQVIYWNAASERIYGYPAGEALGRGIESLIVPAEQRAAALAAIAGVAAGGEPLPSAEVTRVRRDGTPLEVFSNQVVLADADGRRNMYNLDIELTELKRVEAELREYQTRLEQKVEQRTQALSIAKQAAEAASRAKSEFLANMSHELRTPMNAIMGMTGLALRRADDPKLREHLKRIDQASRHLLELVTGILDLSRIEAERLNLDQKDFTLDQVWQDVRGMVQDRLGEKGLQLALDAATGVLAMPLRGDPLRLGQILLNLIDNAIKFTDRGGIRVHFASRDETSLEIGLRIDVQDSGIGIAAADLDRIFDSFEQADNSMTRRHGGTGLGLTISRQLARLMAGDLTVSSQPGHGSTFSLAVRLARATPSPAAPRALSHDAWRQRLARFAGTRVLLAEDDPANRQVVHDLLELVGITVDLAENGQQAVEFAARRPYRLILLDLHMPVTNGIDAARAIRAMPGYAATPILALTANASEEAREQCLAVGINEHLAKPITMEHLYATVLNWLENGTTAA